MSATCFTQFGVSCALREWPGQDLHEVHVTVAPLVGEGLTAFRDQCHVLGVKALVIELGPALPVQPMTCTRVPGPFEDALREAARLREALTLAGFEVRRVKIEAAPWNAGVPVSDAEAATEPMGRYFEHHVRLILGSDDDLTPLQRVCQEHAAHLSRNPFKRRPDGRETRFVTVRLSGLGRERVEQRVQELHHDLRQQGFELESDVTEYCVYDDARNLDHGWEMQK